MTRMTNKWCSSHGWQSPNPEAGGNPLAGPDVSRYFIRENVYSPLILRATNPKEDVERRVSSKFTDNETAGGC